MLPDCQMRECKLYDLSKRCSRLECPNCKLQVPPATARCQCGYKFMTEVRPNWEGGLRGFIVLDDEKNVRGIATESATKGMRKLLRAADLVNWMTHRTIIMPVITVVAAAIVFIDIFFG